MCLVADKCDIGIINPETFVYQTLTNRLANLSDLLTCVAHCNSNDIDKNNTWPLQDFAKILSTLEVEENYNDDNSYKFRFASKVVDVHPSTEKEFFDSIILYCTCCEEIKHNVSILRAGTSDDKCLRNLVPVPMVTLVFEDFTGWFTCIMTGKSVLEMFSLVMNDATQAQWWINLYDTKDKKAIASWIKHLLHLKDGWVEAKLVFKAASDYTILPYIENMVITPY